MTQIKLFKGTNRIVQQEVNDWLKENNYHINVISTQLSIDDHTQCVIIMITYEDFNCEE